VSFITWVAIIIDDVDAVPKPIFAALAVAVTIPTERLKLTVSPALEAAVDRGDMIGDLAGCHDTAFQAPAATGLKIHLPPGATSPPATISIPRAGITLRIEHHTSLARVGTGALPAAPWCSTA
jgi:hypothetical protein